jgi:NAD(P)-dependent dehydrogenase (short-subunit alcohol dehydrogenase family)
MLNYLGMKYMSIDLELKDKVAVVTGAGGGIGREIALALAAEGASIVVNDIGVSLTGEGGSNSPAEETSGLITQKGGKAVISNESVSNWESAQLIIKKAIDTFGKIDIVINNAGILRDTIFHKMEPSDWESVINVHLNGGFYVSRAAAPYFREQNSGSYVHMTSTSGLIGNFGQANYSAAKLGYCWFIKIYCIRYE